jgi:DNA repair protein RadC
MQDLTLKLKFMQVKHIKKEMETVSKVADVKAVYSVKVPAKDRIQIKSPDAVYNILRPFYMDSGFMEQKEIFSCLYLDRSNKILGMAKISEGSSCATIVDIPYIFRLAILMNASSVILCHNHPSGNLQASDADKQITKKIIQAGGLFDIQIFDHLIISSDGFLSMQSEGLI